MNKIKIVALIGKAASGKDSIAKALLEKEPSAHGIVSCTSRPRRDYEIDGRDYHFMEPEDFAKAIEEDTMLEVTNFNGWWYGTSIESLNPDTINVGVFNPEGIQSLLEDDRVEVTVFYVMAKDKTRIIRQLTREHEPDIDEIFRRYTTDEKDFQAHYLDFPYISMDNENSEDFFDCVETIRNIIFM